MECLCCVLFGAVGNVVTLLEEAVKAVLSNLHWTKASLTVKNVSEQQDVTTSLAEFDIPCGAIKNCSKLLSAQRINSIEQIIKSVCVSVSRVCHTKRVERCTDRNLPPIFTKLATKVESQEMWLPIVFGGNPKYFYLPNRKWN